MNLILNYINWNFNPKVFPNTKIHVVWYGVLFALGLYLAYLSVMRTFKLEKVDMKMIDKVSLWILVAVIVGARLGHCFFYEPAYYLSHPLEIIAVWQGGLASHGAAIALIITVILLSRKYKFNSIWFFDRLVIGVAIAGALIRLGNFTNSEIYGIETSLPWGVVFLRNGETIAKHPTQIYESISCIITYIILLVIYNKSKHKPKRGLMFGIFLVSIFLFRFFVEFIKNPQVSFEQNLSLNMGQILSLPFIITGIIFIIWSLTRKGKYKQADFI